MNEPAEQSACSAFPLLVGAVELKKLQNKRLLFRTDYFKAVQSDAGFLKELIQRASHPARTSNHKLNIGTAFGLLQKFSEMSSEPLGPQISFRRIRQINAVRIHRYSLIVFQYTPASFSTDWLASLSAVGRRLRCVSRSVSICFSFRAISFGSSGSIHARFNANCRSISRIAG